MADIMTPALGESVAEATVARWTKKVGDAVKRDEMLIELETDKVSLEVVSPADGVLTEIVAAEGDTVLPGALLGRVTAGAAASPSAPAPAPVAAPAPVPAPAPVAAAAPVAPSVRRIAAETGLDTSTVAGSGKDGRVTKGDALAALEARAAAPAVAAAPSAPRPVHEREDRVKMTRLRQTIARRLKESQNTAAQLTAAKALAGAEIAAGGKRHALVGPTQIDRYGQANISCIGDHAKPKTQMLGVRGFPGNSINHANSFLVPGHNKRVFVEGEVDVVASVGYNPARLARGWSLEEIDIRLIVSDLCVMDFQGPDRQVRIRSLHPGVSAAEVQASTGFPLHIPAAIPTTAAPSVEQLALIRRLDPHNLRAAQLKDNPPGVRAPQ